MEATVFIYALIDPRTDEIKYVGKTNNLNARLYKHINIKLKTKVSCWIRSLLKADLLPIMEILDEVPDSEWQFWEQYWIWLCMSWGFNLKNSTYGGDGGDVNFTAETIKKLREINLGEKNPMYGKKHKQESIDKIIAANLGKKRSMTGCENIRKGKLGHSVSEETRDKISESLKGNSNAVGHSVSEETRNIISTKKKDKPNPKNAEKLKGNSNAKGIHKISKEGKEKMIATHKGKTQSPEQIKKRSESLKKYWADVKSGKVTR